MQEEKLYRFYVIHIESTRDEVLNREHFLANAEHLANTCFPGAEQPATRSEVAVQDAPGPLVLSLNFGPEPQ